MRYERWNIYWIAIKDQMLALVTYTNTGIDSTEYIIIHASKIN